MVAKVDGSVNTCKDCKCVKSVVKTPVNGGQSVAVELTEKGKRALGKVGCIKWEAKDEEQNSPN